MAGIVSATKVQVETCFRDIAKLKVALQQFNQGSQKPTAIPAARITEVDALVDAVVASIAALNT